MNEAIAEGLDEYGGGIGGRGGGGLLDLPGEEWDVRPNLESGKGLEVASEELLPKTDTYSD